MLDLKSWSLPDQQMVHKTEHVDALIIMGRTMLMSKHLVEH